MAPLVRRSLAPCGETPILKHKGAHREKVSVIAALSLSPKRQRLGLYFQTHPKEFVNNVRAAAFVRQLLWHLRGKVILVWDRGNMHRGDPIRQLLRDYPRLSIEELPPYAYPFQGVLVSNSRSCYPWGFAPQGGKTTYDG